MLIMTNQGLFIIFTQILKILIGQKRLELTMLKQMIL